jgi:hypothetical protein
MGRDLGSKRFAYKSGALQCPRSVAEGRGWPGQVSAGVGITLDGRAGISLGCDSIESGRDHRRGCQVRIGVCPRESVLDAERCSLPGDPDRHRPIVLTPRHDSTRGKSRCVPFIGIREGSEEVCGGREMLQQPADGSASRRGE